MKWRCAFQWSCLPLRPPSIVCSGKEKSRKLLCGRRRRRRRPSYIYTSTTWISSCLHSVNTPAFSFCPPHSLSPSVSFSYIKICFCSNWQLATPHPAPLIAMSKQEATLDQRFPCNSILLHIFRFLIISCPFRRTDNPAFYLDDSNIQKIGNAGSMISI